MDQRKVLPPHLFLAFILIMWGAHAVFPFFQVLPESSRIFGILFVMDGLMSVLWARHVLKRQSTAIHSWSEPTALLMEGPYRVTRNPIYLGMTTMLIGVALVFRSVMVLPLPFSLPESFRKSTSGLRKTPWSVVSVRRIGSTRLLSVAGCNRVADSRRFGIR